jgi:hypothetical protein
MTLLEMKKKILSLIEEIDETQATILTNDPDIKSKLPYVINQIQNELSRIKKIPAYIEIEVTEGDTIGFSDIDTEYEVYQLDVVRGVKHDLKAQGTIIKALEDGILEVEYFRYPTAINEKTSTSFEFDLSNDVLEIMPYGVAADLLKSDVSNAYGNVYANRYEQMKQQLDPRYIIPIMEVEGGIDV